MAVVDSAWNYYSETSHCEIPTNSEHTGENSTFTFIPHSHRVSKPIWCDTNISIRIANYKSWHTSQPRQGPIRISCRQALSIAKELVRAMQVDIGYMKRGEFGLYHALHMDPEETYNSKEYYVYGRSWWGKDWSWGVIIGREAGGDPIMVPPPPPQKRSENITAKAEGMKGCSGLQVEQFAFVTDVYQPPTPIEDDWWKANAQKT